MAQARDGEVGMSTVIDYVPKVTIEENIFQCLVCDSTVYRSIAIDHWPMWCLVSMVLQCRKSLGPQA
jgi:hypothetical protein